MTKVFVFRDCVSFELLSQDLSVFLLHCSELFNLNLNVLSLNQSQVFLENEFANFGLFIFHVNFNLALNIASFLKRINLLFYSHLLLKSNHDCIFALFNCVARVLNLFDDSLYFKNTWYLTI